MLISCGEHRYSCLCLVCSKYTLMPEIVPSEPKPESEPEPESDSEPDSEPEQLTEFDIAFVDSGIAGRQREDRVNSFASGSYSARRLLLIQVLQDKYYDIYDDDITSAIQSAKEKWDSGTSGCQNLLDQAVAYYKLLYCDD